MTDLPARGLASAEPIPGGMLLTCDCGQIIIVAVQIDGALTQPQEIAVTCDTADGGCGTTHWMTANPEATP